MTDHETERYDAAYCELDWQTSRARRRETERDRTMDGGAASQADMTAEEFAKSTPSIPTERFDCDGCEASVIGDPRKSDLCTECRRERGLEVPEPLPDGVSLFDE